MVMFFGESNQNNRDVQTLIPKKHYTNDDSSNYFRSLVEEISTSETNESKDKLKMQQFIENIIQLITECRIVNKYENLILNTFDTYFNESLPGIEKYKSVPRIKHMFNEEYNEFKIYHGLVAVSLLFASTDLIKLTNNLVLTISQPLIDHAKNEIQDYGLFLEDENQFKEQNYLNYFAASYLWMVFTQMSLNDFENDFLPFMYSAIKKYQNLCTFWLFYLMANIKSNSELWLSNEKFIALKNLFDNILKQILNNKYMWLSSIISLFEILPENFYNINIRVLKVSLWSLFNETPYYFQFQNKTGNEIVEYKKKNSAKL